ncbi:hypothetical protein E9536_39305 [Burkholderia sp. LS-044]|nr:MULTISPECIES: hypothetical protein [Burkholderia]THJ46804.1 hypothetical protein E9536_39305 [Burkholderia sp. LS-044]UVE67891.1 hypothetical protein L2Y90_27655 [Burkholderia pyrrocinia]
MRRELTRTRRGALTANLTLGFLMAWEASLAVGVLASHVPIRHAASPIGRAVLAGALTAGTLFAGPPLARRLLHRWPPPGELGIPPYRLWCVRLAGLLLGLVAALTA